MGERLELPKGAIYWFGPNLTLRRSTLVISVGSRWLNAPSIAERLGTTAEELRSVLEGLACVVM